ncbi:MAG: SPOR domain-containing protein [Flavobacteriaceae bacterium]|nr:SPOR domain-containing protein [Flavobacteriaceae bacterium]
MTLATYISDLLYRYECVIIPNFGGFVTNAIAAKINEDTHALYPPTKQLTFNKHLQNNDGLLANYIASSKKISFEEALLYIEKEVSFLNAHLKEGVTLKNIGYFSENNTGMLVFEPLESVNYLTASYGLTPVASPPIKREVYGQQVKTLYPEIVASQSSRKTGRFLKYVAAAAIVLSVGSIGLNTYKNQQNATEIAATTQLQEEVERKIQEATFVIDNPLSSLTLKVGKETFNYHVVGGAFKELENVEKLVAKFKKLGYESAVLGVNKWGLTQVSVQSYSTKREAINALYKIQKTISKDAWLLVD